MSIKKNYFYQTVYQVLLSIIPFITSPYVARVFGAEKLGVYSYTFSIASYFVLFANLGIATYGNREIAKLRDDQEKLNISFSEIFGLHIYISFLLIVIYFFYCTFCEREYRILAFVQSIYLFSALVDINWFFFGMEQFKLTVIRNVFIKIATIALIFLFVKKPEDLWKYALILALGTLGSQMVLWFFLHRFVSFVKVTIKNMLKHFKPMLIFFAAVVASSVYTYLDKIMIGRLSAMDQLGFIDNAYKVIYSPLGVVTSLSAVMLPRMVKIYNQDNNSDEIAKRYMENSIKYSMCIACALAFGLLAVGRKFSILFWGKDFTESGILIQVLSCIVLIVNWNEIIRSQYLIPKEKDNVYIRALICGAFTNFFLNLLLIPWLGARGAAFGTICSYIVISIVQTKEVMKDFDVFSYLKASAPFFAIGAIMWICVCFVAEYTKISVAGLLFEIVCGGGIYIIFSTFYLLYKKDPIIYRLLRQMERRENG